MIASVHVHGKRSVADDARHGNSPLRGVYPIGFIPTRSFSSQKDETARRYSHRAVIFLHRICALREQLLYRFAAVDDLDGPA